jgi:hypothetical protein
MLPKNKDLFWQKIYNLMLNLDLLKLILILNDFYEEYNVKNQK